MKKKIKLRDMTKEQWDDYINKCLSRSCSDCIFEPVNCRGSENKRSWFNNQDLYSNKFLDQEIEIEVPDILDEVEKEYLSNVIKPFKNKIIYIKKLDLSNKYSIVIDIYSKFTFSEIEHINLPCFQNNMYKGMELNKSYTLEELGLWNVEIARSIATKA